MTASTGPGGLRRVMQHATFLTSVKIVFGVAVVTFGVIYIAGRWGQMRAALDTSRPAWLVLAGVFAVVGMLWSMIGTRLILQVTSGVRLPLAAAARVFFISQLGKYVPGSVWPIVAVTAMTGRYRIRSTEAASAALLAMFLSLVTGGTFGVLMLLSAGTGGSSALWWLLLLVPVAALLADPRVVFAALNALLKLIRRPVLPGPPPRRLYGAGVGASAISWIFLGLQCWALCVALGAGPGASLLGATGGFALAYTAGTLFVPAPAGAGVREAVLGFALSGAVAGSGSFDADGVIAVVVLSRVLLALLDFACAGIAALVHARASASATPAGST